MALIYRTKILLSVLQELGGKLFDTRMQLLLFLYCVEFVKRDEYYEFIPVGGKPYSVRAEEDRQALIHKNLMEKSTEWALCQTTKRFATDLDFFEKIAIQDLKNNWLQKSDAELVAYVASLYSPPRSADSSELLPKNRTSV